MITVYAPAKINLYLYVVGKRADGYHELITRMQLLELADEITLHLTNHTGVQCRCPGVDLPSDRRNLAVRAAEMFLDAAGLVDRFGVELEICKNIPMAAGLGGGSSDAGAVLRALNGLVESPLHGAKMLGLARRIGADVPFFASGMSAARATGIGEKLQRTTDLAGYWILLINPGFGVSTTWVFENYALTTTEKNSRLRGSRIDDEDRFVPAMLHNDLEQVTLARYPELAEIKTMLLDAGADGALMTGSGATVFGMFAEQAHSDVSLTEVARRITEQFGGRAFLTRAGAGASPSGKAPGFDPGIS